ncbi:hypothetical protein ES705_49297 [subsurface metagenome]
MNNLIDKPGYEKVQKKLDSILQKELEKIGDEFMPREYYIDKWGYKLNKWGHIDYTGDFEFQGPGMNK